VKGRVWEFTTGLRIGRQETADVCLNDASVSRQHAEVCLTTRGWRIRDLGSTNGTFLNGNRLSRGQWPLKTRDLLEIGEFTLVVEAVAEENAEDLVSSLRVEATAQASLDDALQALAFDNQQHLRPGDQLLALLRASHCLGHAESEEELFNSILEDAVNVLDAQRGVIALADGPCGPLRLRSMAVSGARPQRLNGSASECSARSCFSHSLALRCLKRGESILCHKVSEDPELAMAQSIAEGAMDSVLCALLRTPRKRLGILHLDRGPLQDRFTTNDLHLADALAASVSAGIESAQLLRKQRDLFLNSITILAQAVELRDRYTGGHIARVTTYAGLLAEQLEVPREGLELIRIGAPLHDIGKIGIDDAILRKPDRLSSEEFALMRQHTVKGDEILATIPDLAPVRPIVRSHHERWDGRGYPDGLAGEAIPLLARIVSVADAFDAMTSDRPYRPGMSPSSAFAEVSREGGSQFDPQCSAAFLAIRAGIEHELQQLVTHPVAGRVCQVIRG
jgi:HD-GYP domain-containing protein (c-di-GMP phosphodiesterase class II)